MNSLRMRRKLAVKFGRRLFTTVLPVAIAIAVIGAVMPWSFSTGLGRQSEVTTYGVGRVSIESNIALAVNSEIESPTIQTANDIALDYEPQAGIPCEIKFEPSGTHIKDGKLMVRVDLYPVEGSELYQYHHIYTVDETSREFLDGYPGKVDEKTGEPLDPVEYDKWLEGLPHIWRTNPFLCHFIQVPEEFEKADLEGYIEEIFPPDTVATLDHYMAANYNSNLSAHYVSAIMNGKPEYSAQEIEASKIDTEQEKETLIASVNDRLSTLSMNLNGQGEVREIQPQSIDVGQVPADYSGYYPSDVERTFFWDTNPANATGTLDTVQVRPSSSLSNFTTGVFYLISSTTYQCRDSEYIGSAASGATRTFTGLSISVVTGDYLGAYVPASSGRIDESTSIAQTRYYYAGEAKDPGDQASYSSLGTRCGALYGTGAETPSCTEDISNTPSSKAFGTVAASTTYYAKGSQPNNPVQDGDCTFTVTNSSGGAVDLTMKITDFTGGAGWNIVATAPSSNEARITAYYSGQNPASGLVLSNDYQSFKTGLADDGTLLWDFKFETGTFGDGAAKTSTITISAACQ